MIIERYVPYEHKHHVDQAREMVNDYSQHLASQIKKWLYRRGSNIEPKIEDYAEAHRMFYTDPFRQNLIKHYSNVQSLFERVIIHD